MRTILVTAYVIGYSVFTYSMLPHQGHMSIQYALIQFVEKEISLDAMFQRIFPKDIIKKIVHCAYGNEFFEFFIRSQPIELFFDPVLKETGVGITRSDDPALEMYIGSGKCDPQKFSFFNNPTCAYYSALYEAVSLGYNDGHIQHYAKCYGTEVDIQTKHSSPVTAITYPEHLIDGHSEPQIIAGHQDGTLSLLFQDKNIGHITFDDKDHNSIVAMITTPKTLIVTTTRTVALIHEYWLKKSTKKTIIRCNAQFCDIGLQGCMIIGKTKDEKIYTCTPYDYKTFKCITRGAFSPSQASVIYRLIQAKTSNFPQSPEEQKLAPFISPLMSKLLIDQIMKYVPQQIIESSKQQG